MTDNREQVLEWLDELGILVVGDKPCEHQTELQLSDFGIQLDDCADMDTATSIEMLRTDKPKIQRFQ